MRYVEIRVLEPLRHRVSSSSSSSFSSSSSSSQSGFAAVLRRNGGDDEEDEDAIELLVCGRNLAVQRWDGGGGGGCSEDDGNGNGNGNGNGKIDRTIYVARNVAVPQWLEPDFDDFLWTVCTRQAQSHPHSASVAAEIASRFLPRHPFPRRERGEAFLSWRFEVLDGVPAVRLELLQETQVHVREMALVLASFWLFPGY